MASILKVDTITGVTTAGSIAVTGEGNSTTTNLQQGLTKYWIKFDGDDNGVDDSFNHTSITDNGTGDYTVAVANDFANANYSVATCAMRDGQEGGVLVFDAQAAGTTRFRSFKESFGPFDRPAIYIQAVGDLA